MDGGSTIHGVAKESDTTLRLNNNVYLRPVLPKLFYHNPMTLLDTVPTCIFMCVQGSSFLPDLPTWFKLSLHILKFLTVSDQLFTGWNNRLVPNQERSTSRLYIDHPAYLTYMKNTSWEMLDWIKHKLESRLPGEISITSDMQMTPPLWQKAKRNRRASWWKWNKREKADLKLNI